MKLNFKTLCACLALIMYAGTSVAMDGDWSDELTYNQGVAGSNPALPTTEISTKIDG